MKYKSNMKNKEYIRQAIFIQNKKREVKEIEPS